MKKDNKKFTVPNTFKKDKSHFYATNSLLIPFSKGGYMAPILPSPMKNPNTPIFRDTTALPFGYGGNMYPGGGQLGSGMLGQQIRQYQNAPKKPLAVDNPRLGPTKQSNQGNTATVIPNNKLPKTLNTVRNPEAEKKALEKQTRELVQSGAASRSLGTLGNSDKSLYEQTKDALATDPNFLDKVAKNEYQYQQKLEQKAYDNASYLQKGVNFGTAFLSNPITTGANLLEGYRPLMNQAEVLRDANNPQNVLMRNTGGLDNIFNAFNPGAYVANYNSNIKKGNYADAAVDAADILLAPTALGAAGDLKDITKAGEKVGQYFTSKVPTKAEKLSLKAVNQLVDNATKKVYHQLEDDAAFSDLSTSISNKSNFNYLAKNFNPEAPAISIEDFNKSRALAESSNSRFIDNPAYTDYLVTRYREQFARENNIPLEAVSNRDVALYGRMRESELLPRTNPKDVIESGRLGTKEREAHNKFLADNPQISSDLTPEEEVILDSYTLGYDRNINNRGNGLDYSTGQIPEFYSKEVAPKLEEIIKKNKLAKEQRLIRGTSDFIIGEGGSNVIRGENVLDNINFSDLQIGDVFVPKSFTSTSASNYLTNNFVTSNNNPDYAIIAPKGQSFVYPNSTNIQRFPNESEVILPKDLQFKLEKIASDRERGVKKSIKDFERNEKINLPFSNAKLVRKPNKILPFVKSLDQLYYEDLVNKSSKSISSKKADAYLRSYNTKLKPLVPKYEFSIVNPYEYGGNLYSNGGMLKRADGSYSKRGLWDNIRANAGSGKAPTKEMLKQEKKINKELAYGGSLEGGRKTNLPEDNFMKGGRNIYDSVYASSLGDYYTNGGNLHDSIINSNLDNYFTAMNKLTGGGNIHIKPENRGKFTASAKNAGMGVQAFAQKVLANKEDYSSTQVKRANFARNAAGWNHGVGGFLFAQGGQMNQLTEFNEGGLHEENPLGGIPQGVNQDGQVNLVEEGETKLNSQNYVFSDKLKVDAETAAQFNLPKSSIGKTFSEVSKKANRPSSRREGDDIEERAKIKDLDSLMQAQEAYKQRDAEQKIAELEALHPGALESLVGQQGGMPQGPEAMGQEQMPPMSEEEAMMMQQQMAMQGAPQSYGGSMYAFGGNMKNPEAAQKLATGLGMAAPFLNLIPGVGQVASLATGAAAKGLGMAANNAMATQSEQEATMQANRMGNDYGGAIPTMNPALGYAYGGPMTRQLVGGGYGLNSSQLANIGQYPTGLSDMQKRNVGMPMGLNYGQQQNVGISDFEDDADILTADVADNSTDSTGDIPDYMQYGNWKDAQTDLEGADETLGDNSGDYSVNQTPFQAALNLAPAVYNTATGIFGKVKQLNPEDYMVKSNVKAPLIDITPQERAAQQTYAAAQSGLAGAGPGAGAYMTNMQNLASMRNAALGEMYTKKANIDAANQFEADKFNTQLTASNADKRFAIEDYNNRAKAAKTAMLQEGLKQFAGYSDAQTQNQIAMQYGKMGSPDMSRIMKWGYTPYNPFKK